MTNANLSAEVGASRTDLARVVQAAADDERLFVVVSAKAVQAWQQRDPQAWVNVCNWLASQGKTVVVV
ncbi:MAG TPA: hypothetical protein VFN71_13595 [Methylomirabilota bacterium]|nr:hypothetical protein [Methylomirabilota bacterium]